MQGLVEALQSAVDQFGRLGLSNFALFLFFVAIYVATAVVIVFSNRLIARLAAFLLNQLLTAAVVLFAFKSALPAAFPWKEALGMAVVSFGAVFMLMRLIRSGGAYGLGSSSQKGYSGRARKLAESSQKAAALKAQQQAGSAYSAQPEMEAEPVPQTVSDISRRIESHSRKRGPMMKTAAQGGFTRR